MDYEFLKKYLKEHKITRAKFAKLLGVSVYTINNWFARQPKNIPMETIMKIAQVLHISWSLVAGVYPIDEGRYMELPSDGEARIFDGNGNLLGVATDFKHSMQIESESEGMLLQTYRLLNDIGQKLTLRHIYLLADIPEFQRKDAESALSDDE